MRTSLRHADTTTTRLETPRNPALRRVGFVFSLPPSFRIKFYVYLFRFIIFTAISPTRGQIAVSSSHEY